MLGPDKKPQSRMVRLGITDGTATEMIEGDLKEGEIDHRRPEHHRRRQAAE